MIGWRKIAKIATVAITVGCLVHFGLRLVRDWDSVTEAAAGFGSKPWLIVAEFGLMLLNVGVECLRWSVVRKFFTGGTAEDDVVGTLRAISLGNATPANLGEHVGRTIGYDSRGRAFAASITASFIQTAAIFLLACVAASFVWEEHLRYHTKELLSLPIVLAMFVPIVIIIVMGLYVRVGGRREQVLRFVRRRGFWRMFDTAFLLNVVKVAIFSSQLTLLLAQGSDTENLFLFALTLVYYGFVTVVPRVNIADVGIKGSMAQFFFGSFVGEGCVAASVVAIWALNIVLPSVVGFATMPIRRRAKR